jgi:hypothetical protein
LFVIDLSLFAINTYNYDLLLKGKDELVKYFFSLTIFSPRGEGGWGATKPMGWGEVGA